MDDGIRERLGVEAVAGYAEARETEQHITVALWDGDSGNPERRTHLKPPAARKLARQLYRLAKRIEGRNGA